MHKENQIIYRMDDKLRSILIGGRNGEPLLRTNMFFWR